MESGIKSLERSKHEAQDKIQALGLKITGCGGPSPRSTSSLSKHRRAASAGCGLLVLDRESTRLLKCEIEFQSLVGNLNPKLSALGLDLIHEKSLKVLRVEIDKADQSSNKKSSNYQKIRDDVLKQQISFENCEYVAKQLEQFMDLFRKELCSTQSMDEHERKDDSAQRRLASPPMSTSEISTDEIMK